MSSSDARFARAPGVVARKVAGELVLVPIIRDLRTEASGHPGVFVLNETAEALWEFMSQPRTLTELAQHLSRNFEVTEERATVDVDDLLGAMRDRGVVLSLGTANVHHNEEG
jgi:hypothetical protein